MSAIKKPFGGLLHSLEDLSSLHQCMCLIPIVKLSFDLHKFVHVQNILCILLGSAQVSL